MELGFTFPDVTPYEEVFRSNSTHRGLEYLAKDSYLQKCPHTERSPEGPLYRKVSKGAPIQRSPEVPLYRQVFRGAPLQIGFQRCP